MNTSMITCPNCKKSFEITDAIQKQIEDELRKEYESLNEKAVNEAVSTAVKAYRQQSDVETEKLKFQIELAEEKAKNAAELARDKERQKSELETVKLQSQIEAERESNKEFQKQLKEVLNKLNKAEKEKETAELKAKEQLHEKEKLIRKEAIQEATQKANENNYTKIREQEETIRKLNEQLTEAKQVAEQGSQQLQGEILELDMEKLLNANFKFDTITEVKKGEHGADIRQIINDFSIQNCGLVLWECKNAKNWSDKWVDKLKEEIIDEKAQVGIIVWYSPNNADDYKQLKDNNNIWVVKPQYAAMLGVIIRDSIIKISVMNRNNENKVAKTELLYNYLMGDEFKNRFQTIITAYTDMQNSQKKERLKIKKMWAEQDKLIDVIQYNLVGMSGDMKGIAGKEIIALPEFDENKN